MLRSSLVLLAAASVSADIYLHNPRGSNNRLDDENRDRNNANRLFDSQNNNRGGSNVGSLYYLDGSTLDLEWTAQHSCGADNNHCEIVIQYMCDSVLRDGTTTNTIPINPKECYGYDCDTDVRFGRHESLESYYGCKYRERNKGLFTASQNLKGNAAIYTRQNPNGARRGLECPEERDYYPYWGPTKWKDIAILTNDETRCANYQAESQNVKSRYHCEVPMVSYMRWYNQAPNNMKKLLPALNQTECETITYEDVTTNSTVYGQWKEVAAHGIAAPKCMPNHWSRDNHLGNIKGAAGEQAGFRWTVPADFHEQCALRIRYNISTGDIPNFDGDDEITTAALTAANNTKGNNRNDESKTDVASFYGLDMNERAYQLKNNPQVDAFDLGDDVLDLQLAINTAQYGRTFQDRSHKFAIRQAPAADVLDCEGKIHNLNVRGKRGNIVQTYPGTEYDFTPNTLHTKEGECVHFQWTGSNTNPNNNAGQGRQGSDRSNVVILGEQTYDEPTKDKGMTEGQKGRSYPRKLDDGSAFLGFDRISTQHLAILDNMQYGGEMSELDDAGTYFDLGPQKVSGNNKVYNYMCTRNNNFSNRSQKGKVVVSDTNQETTIFGSAAASYTVGAMQLVAATDTFKTATTLTVSSSPQTLMAGGKQPMSEIVSLVPMEWDVNKGVTVKMSYQTNLLKKPQLLTGPSAAGPWTVVKDTTYSKGIIEGSITQGGFYMVEGVVSGVAVLVIILIVGLIAGAVGFVLYKKKQGGSGGSNSYNNRI